MNRIPVVIFSVVTCSTGQQIRLTRYLALFSVPVVGAFVVTSSALHTIPLGSNEH